MFESGCILIGIRQKFDKLVFVGLLPELTVDSRQWTVKESLRDDFNIAFSNIAIFEILDGNYIAIISNNPRRGYHNCPLSTVNCPLERSDKHQFTGQLRETQFCFGSRMFRFASLFP